MTLPVLLVDNETLLSSLQQQQTVGQIALFQYNASADPITSNLLKFYKSKVCPCRSTMFIINFLNFSNKVAGKGCNIFYSMSKLQLTQMV